MKKEEHEKFSVAKTVKFTRRIDELLQEKARERRTTDSEIIRQAVASYMNRAMSDAEIVHASLVENSRKIRYLENKVELLALVIFEQTKLLMRRIPNKQVNLDSAVDVEFDKFKQTCSKALKSNHAGVLEMMVLDAYERGGGDNGEH